MKGTSVQIFTFCGHNHFASIFTCARAFTLLTSHPKHNIVIVMSSLSFSGRAFPLTPGQPTLPFPFLLRRGACHFRRPLPPIKRGVRFNRAHRAKCQPRKKKIRRNLALLPRPPPPEPARTPAPEPTPPPTPAPVLTPTPSAATTPPTSTLIPGHLPARLPDTPTVSAREARMQGRRRLGF